MWRSGLLKTRADKRRNDGAALEKLFSHFGEAGEGGWELKLGIKTGSTATCVKISNFCFQPKLSMIIN